MKRYILSLDQGTSSSRAILFDENCNQVASAQREFTQLFPQPGWVEHDPYDILNSQLYVMGEVLSANPEKPVSAIGIANQRETTIVWEASTGKPVYNAIVWQDRRTAEYCALLNSRGLGEDIRKSTGLLPDAYFSASKIKWILDNVPGAREKASRGELRFGNVDSWLLWNLSGGRVHATDVSNASRTMLFDIHKLEWDSKLLALFDIPASMMPEVRSSAEVYCEIDRDALRDAGFVPPVYAIPVSGIAGDQQSALFGQMCLEEGSVKNTYGTGCFLLMNTGGKPVFSQNRLLTTVAWKIGDRVDYALEGSIFTGGSVVQWLRDGLGIIRTSSEIEQMASEVPDNGGVYFVPALTGLGAPWWNPDARGTICGITRGSTAAHIARAALEGIAFQTMDIVHAMEKDSGIRLRELKVDGGASRNNLLMQFQSDILGAIVIRPKVTETTALGAACLAGIGAGVWSSPEELRSIWQMERHFSPSLPPERIEALKAGWSDAVSRCNL
ncbi:MAG: glycerol kinase GlpK [Bacteroidales bacterium]|nr:glycerol kinase GlpK [Bacteroidales bacterium]